MLPYAIAGVAAYTKPFLREFLIYTYCALVPYAIAGAPTYTKSPFQNILLALFWHNTARLHDARVLVYLL